MLAMPGDVLGCPRWESTPDAQWVKAADVAKGPVMRGGGGIPTRELPS